MLPFFFIMVREALGNGALCVASIHACAFAVVSPLHSCSPLAGVVILFFL